MDAATVALLQQARDRAEANRRKMGIVLDRERIAALPRQDFSSRHAELVDKWTRVFRRSPTARPLRPVQAEVLEEAYWAAQQTDPIGLIGNVGVGKGKTLTFLLLQEVFDAQRPVLLIPSDMMEPLQEAIWEWSQEYHFRIPTVVTYPQLSRPEATDLLTTLRPDVVFADECHMLRHASAARTKRFIRYMRANPEVRFVAMSGTLTGSGLGDYAHLCEIALRQYSPLPLDEVTLQKWGAVLNADGEPDGPSWESVSSVCPKGAAAHNAEVAREEFYSWFKGSPGVVTTETPSSQAHLVLRAVRPPVSEAVRHHLKVLADDYVLPDGTEVVDSLHFYRAARQLALGFYYVWDWPDGEADVEWLDARREWARGVREYLKRHAREGCDSPFLVEEHVRRTGRPESLRQALSVWEVQREKPPPPVRPIWVDMDPVLHAIEWGLTRDQGIIWFSSQAVGDLLQASGIPTYWEGTPKEGVVALSMTVYHKGRNFQKWSDQLVLEPPSSGATWEQLLGRTHRQGQAADTVTAEVYQHLWPLQHAMRTARQRAEYIQGVTGQQQKLLIAITEGFPWD